MQIAFLVGSLLLLGVFAWLVKRRLDALPTKAKKQLLKRKLNGVFVYCEDRGWIPRNPAFQRDYLGDFPALAKLEAGYPAVRSECLALLEHKERLTNASALGGSFTTAGIHTISWKTFVFKSGDFIEENCARCPRTAALLREIPGLYTAFFSVLEPRQVIAPHWGYYKGILRYHLGVLIPNDNADEACWLRVHADPYDNALERDKKNKQRDTSSIVKGEIYHWHDGEGIVFDDNYLHDAGNNSDQVRVVLWLDLKRPLPLPLDLFNRLVGWVASRDASMRKIRSNVIVHD
ncbi:MAG TPA: aspartyl/asparaginyl beta-hydroxylase domain-containing protein [Myxococcota bacterium]|jgi:beta-hydroxylase